MGGWTAMVRRAIKPTFQSEIMAEHIVPHFHNDPGVAVMSPSGRLNLTSGILPKTA